MRILALNVLLVIIVTVTAQAETFFVRPDGTGDYPTIQEAIQACEHGDVVELDDGLFTGEGNRDINNWETMVVVRSASGDPEACIIDCEGSEADPHRGFVFVITGSKPPVELALRGVTVRNGWQPGGGAVVAWDGTSPTIENCIFENNRAGIEAGAFYSDESLPILRDCIFRNNQAPKGGAVVLGYDGAARIEGCLFTGNTAEEGGALYCRHTQIVMVVMDCTFAGNTADRGAAIFCTWFSLLPVRNTIVAFNGPGEGIGSEEASVIDLSCSDIFGNEGGDWTGSIADQLGVAGNISADPLFCGLPVGDFTIRSDSPCSPGHHPDGTDCGWIGAEGEGCEPPTSTEHSTWGALKQMFR